MKRIILLLLILLTTLPLAMANTNLEFNIDTPDKLLYPDQDLTIPISITNKDSTFYATGGHLTINIGERTYTYAVDDLLIGDEYLTNLKLPAFPPGTHTLKGMFVYEGMLGETFTKDMYASFEVLFPPIERFPRNVFVADYDLPEKIIEGKSYDVSATIMNDGEVSADLLVEFGSIDEFVTVEFNLKPGESKKIEERIKFAGAGVNLIEVRAYALIDGKKYLLNYRGKNVFTEIKKEAKLLFDRLELVQEVDERINQDDIVEFKIILKNDGDTATEVKTSLTSNNDKIILTDNAVYYDAVVKKTSYAPEGDVFKLITNGTMEGMYELNMKINYFDSENREKHLIIPISIVINSVCEDFDDDGYDSKKCLDDDDKPNEDCNDFDPSINPSI